MQCFAWSSTLILLCSQHGLPGTLYPFQCHCVIPTPPHMEMRPLLYSCGMALSTPKGLSAVLKGQRVQVKESCIHTLRRHTFNFIPSLPTRRISSRLGRNCLGAGYTDPDPGGCDGSRIIKARPGHSRGLSREDKGKRQALKYYLACSHWSAKGLSSLLSRVPRREKKKLSY